MPLDHPGQDLRVLNDQSYLGLGGGNGRSRSMCAYCRRPRAFYPKRDRGGALSRGPLFRLNVVPVKLRRCASGARISPSWSATSWLLCRRAPDSNSVPVVRGNGRASRRTSGRATSASCGTSSSARLSRARRRVGCIEVDLLPSEVLDSQGSIGVTSATMTIMGSPLREARESFEREYLKIQIRRFSGNISRTASFIGMERSALHRKLKALGIGDKRDGEE